MKQSLVVLAVLLLAFSSLGETKKPKTQKVIYVQKVPAAPRQLTEYELCKQECRIQRDSQSNRDRVEQLKQELEEAEQLLAEHNKNVDAPEIAPERAEAAGQVPVVRKASRFDHLKMAANKIVESTSELKNAVTGGGEEN
uniref:Signal peptide-containing protein n=1 Tax=Caenorhabditis tropicalis TaxID=1561998 RepID=A0A1I7TLY9_9PELO